MLVDILKYTQFCRIKTWNGMNERPEYTFKSKRLEENIAFSSFQNRFLFVLSYYRRNVGLPIKSKNGWYAYNA